MLHPTEEKMIKDNAKRFAKEVYCTDNPTQDQIAAATSLLANTAQNLVDNNMGYEVPYSGQAEAFLHTLQSEYAAASPNLSIGNGQYLFYATPDQKSSPYINSGTQDNEIADLINKTSITTPFNGSVFSANNPFSPINPFISAECIPQGRPGAGPDYISISANFYIFSGGGAVNLHNGDVFGQWTLGRAYPGYALKPGGSIMFGNILGGADAQSTNNFLRGGGAQGSTIVPFPVFPLIGAGGGINHSYGGSTSVEYGIGTPGAGVAPVGYGFDLKTNKD